MHIGHQFKISNSDDYPTQTVSLPLGWACHFPATASLLYLFSTLKNVELDDLRYQKNLNLAVIWQPLLMNDRALSPYDFPPEMLASMGNTIEIQAAFMLIHLSTKFKFNLVIDVPLLAEHSHSRLLSIIQHADANLTTQLDRTPTQILGLLVFKADDIDTCPAPSFENIEDVLALQTINRFLLAYWVQDLTYLSEKAQDSSSEECNLLQVLEHHRQTQERKFNTHVSSPLARYYVFTGTFASDEVVIDKLFLRSYERTEQLLWAELVNVYAHIKCGLAYPEAKFTAIVNQCRRKGLDYWLAYFLSYGHVLKTGAGIENRELQYLHLTEAFHIYRKLGDWAAATRALHSKSTLLSKKLRFKNANKYLEICLGIRLFLQDTLGIARVLNGTSYIKSQLEDFEGAINSAIEATQYLSNDDQIDELAFTCSQISWYYFLTENYAKAVEFGLKTIEIMNDHNVHTLPFRTKPDIHAQLGLCYAYHGDIDKALSHSDYCESHKVDSTATGEIFRIILRAIINDYRENFYLSDISYAYIPEILATNPEIDPHLEVIYYRILVERYKKQNDDWNVKKFTQKAKALCLKHQYSQTLKWFNGA